MLSFYRLLAALLWICASCMGAAISVNAQIPAPQTQQSAANILPITDYLRDPSGALGLRDVLRPKAAKTFRPYSLERFNAADPNSRHWFRFQVTAPRDAPYRATLYFTDPQLKRATLYRQVVGATADVIRYDPSAQRDDSVTTSGGIGLPLRVDRGQTTTVFLTLEGPDLSGQLQLWQPNALTAHLQQQRHWRTGLLGVLGAACALALSAALYKQQWSWLFLAAGCTAYGAYLLGLAGPVHGPSWIGSLDVLLLLAVIVAASVQHYVVSLAQSDGAFLMIRWWSVVCSAALFMSAALSALFPGPAALFSYVFFIAASGLCAFVAIALLTFKTARYYRLKAGLAAVLAAAIAVVPQWPFVMSDHSLWLQTAVCAALLCACTFCWWPRRAFAATYAENTGVDTFAIKSMLASEQVQVEVGPTMDHIPDQMPGPLSDAAQQEAGHKTGSNAAEEVHPSQYGRPSIFDTQGLDETAFDEMTGVLTAESVRAMGSKAIERAKRYHQPYTALLMRIEGFEEMRSLLGQVTVDRAAKLLAVTCMRELRESDALGRLYDDCFLALLPETDLAGARSALLRTKKNIDERTVPTRAGMKKLDVSAAVTLLSDDDDTVDQVLERMFGDLALEAAESRDALTGQGPLPTHAAE